MKKGMKYLWFLTGILLNFLNTSLLFTLCFLHHYFINKVIPFMIVVPLIIGWKVHKQNPPLFYGIISGLIMVVIFIFHAFSICYVIQ